MVMGGGREIRVAAARLAQHEGTEVTDPGRAQGTLVHVPWELGQIYTAVGYHR
jgi:hypothetical protein